MRRNPSELVVVSWPSNEAIGSNCGGVWLAPRCKLRKINNFAAVAELQQLPPRIAGEGEIMPCSPGKIQDKPAQ
jgi:hypothetical protein